MWWRLAFPLLFLFAPGLMTRVKRMGYLVWKLSFEPRVPLLFKLFVPVSLLYLLTPLVRIPILGPIGFLVFLGLAVWLLVNLSPRYVVEGYAPWRVRSGEQGRGGQGSARVVEGKYELQDDEERHK